MRPAQAFLEAVATVGMVFLPFGGQMQAPFSAGRTVHGRFIFAIAANPSLSPTRPISQEQKREE